MGRCITYIYFTTTFYQCNNGTEHATISIANDYILVHWCNLCQHQSTITHYNVKCSEPYVFAPHCISNLLSLIHYMYLFRNMLIWILKISGVYCWLNQKFHEVELTLSFLGPISWTCFWKPDHNDQKPILHAEKTLSHAPLFWAEVIYATVWFRPPPPPPQSKLATPHS